jgi:hypothetical protein
LKTFGAGERVKESYACRLPLEIESDSRCTLFCGRKIYVYLLKSNTKRLLDYNWVRGTPRKGDFNGSFMNLLNVKAFLSLTITADNFSRSQGSETFQVCIELQSFHLAKG